MASTSRHNLERKLTHHGVKTAEAGIHLHHGIETSVAVPTHALLVLLLLILLAIVVTGGDILILLFRLLLFVLAISGEFFVRLVALRVVRIDGRMS